MNHTESSPPFLNTACMASSAGDAQPGEINDITFPSFRRILDQGSAWVCIQHILVINFWKVSFTQAPHLLTASFVSKADHALFFHKQLVIGKYF